MKHLTISQIHCRLSVNATFLQIFNLSSLPDSTKKNIVFFWADSKKSVGTVIGENEIESMGAIIQIVDKKDAVNYGNALFYLRQAVNATSGCAQFAMFMSAMEAIAGEKIINRRQTLDKDEFSRCFGIEIKEKMFAHGVGIRNTILHGRTLTPDQNEEYNEKMLEALIGYFNREIGTRIVEDLRGAPRGPIGNAWYRRYWFVKPQIGDLCIRTLHQSLSADPDTKQFGEEINQPEDY